MREKPGEEVWGLGVRAGHLPSSLLQSTSSEPRGQPHGPQDARLPQAASVEPLSHINILILRALKASTGLEAEGRESTN